MLPTVRRIRMWDLYGALVLAFLLFPLVTVVVFSFNAYPFYSLPLRGLTFEWYAAVLDSPQIVQSFLHSLRIAVLASLGATLIGTAAAYAVIRFRFRGRGWLLALGIAPLITPVLILGISFQILFRSGGLNLNMWTVVVGHITYTTPFVFVILLARFMAFDFRLERAAMDLGAAPWLAFRLVTLPVIGSAVVGGALFAFLLSLNEFTIAFFTGGSPPTLPILVWSSLKVGIKPTLLAYSSMIIFLAVLVALVALRTAGEVLRRRRRQAGEAFGAMN